MATDHHTQLLYDPQEVDVVSIERELALLWKNAAESIDGSSAPAVRACSLNFIVISEDEREIDELSTMVGDVTLEHPARVFLLSVNRRTGTPKLEAWISARCSLPVPGGKQICSEQINIVAHGGEANKVPSIVTSLLVSDVPGILLWKLRVDPNDGMLRSLAHILDRMIIDSSEDLAPAQGLLSWCDFIAAHGAHMSFGDMAWTHLVPWRSVVANAFNPPERRAQLGAIDRVTIEYSSSSQPRHSGISQALLLTGWLGQKLGWMPVRTMEITPTGEYMAKFRLGEQAITMRLLPVGARDGFPGGIESVAIHTHSGLDLKFAATRHRDCVMSSKHGNGDSAEELLTILSDKSESALVAQELEVTGRDEGYEAALAALKEFVTV